MTKDYHVCDKCKPSDQQHDRIEKKLQTIEELLRIVVSRLNVIQFYADTSKK